MTARIKLPPPYSTDLGEAEADVIRALREAAKTFSVLLWRTSPFARTSTGGRRKTQSVGIPDWLGMAPDGRVIAIEAKRRGGSLSIEQLDVLRQVGRAGGLAFVVCTTDGALALLSAISKGGRVVAKRLSENNVWII